MLALVDYGAGNLASVRKGLAAAGGDHFVPERPADLARAAGIVVPGVGHFAATAALDEVWRSAILEHASRGTPLLGICLGLQFLFDGSDEAQDVAGLGLLKGRCFRLPPTRKVPHVGWNTVQIRSAAGILRGVADGSSFYFTHSYAAPVTAACAGETEYTALFAAVVESGTIFGVQFHPEKSGDAGIRVLRNFVEACRC